MRLVAWGAAAVLEVLRIRLPTSKQLRPGQPCRGEFVETAK